MAMAEDVDDDFRLLNVLAKTKCRGVELKENFIKFIHEYNEVNELSAAPTPAF